MISRVSAGGSVWIEHQTHIQKLVGWNRGISYLVSKTIGVDLKGMSVHGVSIKDGGRLANPILYY
jgi:hypothetical protein